jgi:hypothetical protein
MSTLFRHFVLSSILFVASLGAQTAPVQSPAVQKMLKLFTDLTRAGSTKEKVQFQFTEGEVNEYLNYARVANPRPGLDRLTVKFFPQNYLSTFTVVDFDMVEKARPGTVPLLLKPVLSGKKAIWVDLRLNAGSGLGTFSVEKARFQNIPLPAFLVETAINVIGSRQKEKFDTSKPVPLPFGLRWITTSAQAVRGAN